MNRRKLLVLTGGAVVSTVTLGTIAPPAQAFVPFLLRLLLGQAVRSSLKDAVKARKKVPKVRKVSPKNLRFPTRKSKTKN